MKSLEPKTETAQCSGGGGLSACVISPVCGLRGMLGGAQDAFWQYLDQYTVEDLIKKNGSFMQSMTSRLHQC